MRPVLVVGACGALPSVRCSAWCGRHAMTLPPLLMPTQLRCVLRRRAHVLDGRQDLLLLDHWHGHTVPLLLLLELLCPGWHVLSDSLGHGDAGCLNVLAHGRTQASDEAF